MSETLWEAVGNVISLADQQLAYTPLTESELVERTAIDFANTPTTREWLELLGGLQLPAQLWKREEDTAAIERVLVEMLGPQHKRFVDDLAAIVAGEDTTEIATRSLAAGARMVLVPTYELVDGALQVRHRYIAETLDARLAYVLMLLLDAQRDYGRRLCRCRLERCRKFFWEIPSESGMGTPRRLYCSEEHSEAYKKEMAAERVRASRERKKRGVVLRNRR